jgi:hypothetical protein
VCPSDVGSSTYDGNIPIPGEKPHNQDADHPRATKRAGSLSTPAPAVHHDALGIFVPGLGPDVGGSFSIDSTSKPGRGSTRRWGFMPGYDTRPKVLETYSTSSKDSSSVDAVSNAESRTWVKCNCGPPNFDHNERKCSSFSCTQVPDMRNDAQDQEIIEFVDTYFPSLLPLLHNGMEVALGSVYYYHPVSPSRLCRLLTELRRNSNQKAGEDHFEPTELAASSLPTACHRVQH